MNNKIIELHEEGFPVIVWSAKKDNDFVREVTHYLINGHKIFLHEDPDYESISGWAFVFPVIFNVFDGYPLILEYPLLGGPERVDIIVVGRSKALIVEAKEWRGNISKINYLVKVDGDLRIDPCYQLNNYVSKFRFLHSAAEKMEFDGLVYLHGALYKDNCKISLNKEDLEKYVDWLGSPGDAESIKYIVNGKFQLSEKLVEYIKNNRQSLLKNAVEALLGGGYGLTEEQLMVIEDVLESLKEGGEKAYFVKGVSGSGKTLVALTLFFEAISKGYKTLLTYRNNRLLNTLRISIGGELSNFIRFYSMGPQGRYRGVAERNFPVGRYGVLDLIIYDEAQRMTTENIEISLSRSKVKVYFYDSEQVLIDNEAGIESNFVSIAERRNVKYDKYEFSVPRRIPKNYLKEVRNLLYESSFNPKNIEFKIFKDIKDMLQSLEDHKNKGYRVALVAAFTETPGNKKNTRAPDNLRIGYPLCKLYDSSSKKCKESSDLDIYKDLGIEIYWLMDEKKEYPMYWMGKLDPLKYCASVYGAQGFEAEYVGVIWGRDLIWRDGWMVNPDPITDNIGNENSLASLAKKNKSRALELLKNRYLILLTRGTKGTYVFFEDDRTRKYVESLVN